MTEDHAPTNSAANGVAEAARVLQAGGLVGLPTETVYGLAADATDDRAVARIFEAKGRPSFNPLIAHVSSLEEAGRYAELSPIAKRLANSFWPGPLTLVLPRKADSPISLLVSAGLDTVAFRAPGHPVTRAVLKASGLPLAAPSANKSGSISPTTADHVRAGLGLRSAGGALDYILDGGPCAIGVESTIIKVDGDDAILLRPGGVPRDAIERVVGAPLGSHLGGVEAPGMLSSHYAPNVSVRLGANAPEKDEAFLAFGPDPSPAHPYTLNLSPAGNLAEAASNLFAHLRALDVVCSKNGLKRIAVAPIPATGLGEAINDRLTRAAAPRCDARD